MLSKRCRLHSSLSVIRSGTTPVVQVKFVTNAPWAGESFFLSKTGWTKPALDCRALGLKLFCPVDAKSFWLWTISFAYGQKSSKSFACGHQLVLLYPYLRPRGKGPIANRARVPLPELFSKLGWSSQIWKRASVLRFFELWWENRKFPKFSKFEWNLWRKRMTRQITRLLSPIPNRATPCSPRPCIIRIFGKGRWLQEPKTRQGKIENRISANNFGAKIVRKWNSWIFNPLCYLW